MSTIHSSWALLGRRSALRWGTARLSTVRSIEYSRQGSVSTASPIHSRGPARRPGVAFACTRYVPLSFVTTSAVQSEERRARSAGGRRTVGRRAPRVRLGSHVFRSARPAGGVEGGRDRDQDPGPKGPYAAGRSAGPGGAAGLGRPAGRSSVAWAAAGESGQHAADQGLSAAAGAGRGRAGRARPGGVPATGLPPTGRPRRTRRAAVPGPGDARARDRGSPSQGGAAGRGAGTVARPGAGRLRRGGIRVGHHRPAGGAAADGAGAPCRGSTRAGSASPAGRRAG